MMQRQSKQREHGSVLMMALVTITILTMVCVTSLYVTTQTATATTQTASWQQAMGGAEAVVDRAKAALDQDAKGLPGAWSGWYTVTPGDGRLPDAQPNPSGTPNATGRPTNGQYNYYPSTFTAGQGSNAVRMWAIVDNGSLSPSSGNLVSSYGQAYRIRATAAADAPGPARVSNNKLDNDLRKISLKYDRTGGSAATTPQAIRRVEVVAVPVAPHNSGRGITAINWISLSGSMTIDSFDSSDPLKSSTINGVAGQYDPAKRQTHGDAGTTNSTGSDFRNTYVYGSVGWSGPPIKNTTHVQGTMFTPFDVQVPPVTQPTWTGTYTQYTAGGSNPPNSGVFRAGPQSNPALIKVNGDLIVSSSGHPLRIQRYDSSGTPARPGNAIVIWVTGQLKTQGSGYIAQDSNVAVTYYVGSSITVSGSSYQNQSGLAANLTLNGYGQSNSVATVSGSADFIGSMNVPNYATTISGGGAWIGGLTTNKLTMSGSSNFHYDEVLRGSNSAAGSYAYASWFEDNSDCWIDGGGHTHCRTTF